MMEELSWAYGFLDRKQEALELAQKGLAIRKEPLNDGDPRYWAALNELACVHHSVGGKAIGIFEKAIFKGKTSWILIP